MNKQELEKMKKEILDAVSDHRWYYGFLSDGYIPIARDNDVGGVMAVDGDWRLLHMLFEVVEKDGIDPGFIS